MNVLIYGCFKFSLVSIYTPALCVCVYVFIWVCVCACLSVCVCACVFMCVCVYLCVCPPSSVTCQCASIQRLQRPAAEAAGERPWHSHHLSPVLQSRLCGPGAHAQQWEPGEGGENRGQRVGLGTQGEHSGLGCVKWVFPQVGREGGQELSLKAFILHIRCPQRQCR